MSAEASSPVKICFLFHSKAFWPSWESFWHACQEDPRVEATMLFCPVRKQAPGYEDQFIDAEDFLNDKSIPYIHIEDYDFDANAPDYIIIQTPYDQYHRDQKWHSENFKRRGIKVAYISYGLEFVETVEAIKNHFCLPIHQCADRIFTFADFMQEDYKTFGSIGSNVVKSVGHPKFDALFTASRDNLPADLRKRIGERKCIVWHPHFPCKNSLDNGTYVQSTFSWEKNVQMLNYMTQQKDVFFIFMAHHLFWGAFEKIFNIPSDYISLFRSTIVSSENMALWEDDYPDVLACADAVIGERSAVTMEALFFQKPVCYLEQKPEIYNRFGKDALSAFYYASEVEPVFEFIENIKKGIDSKAEVRKQVFDTYLKKHFDGQCGERIKEELISSALASRELAKQPIHIFMTFAEDIVMPATVAICSIVRNTNRHINFYVLQNADMPISEESKRNISSLNVKNNFTVEYISIDSKLFYMMSPSASSYITNDTYFRYLIPQLKDIDKCIYLDIDIICDCDISTLYDIDMKDYFLGAARKDKVHMSDYVKKVVAKTGIKNPANYFNAGVLLINCKAWRENGITQKLIDTTLALTGKIDWADQDVLNIVFEETNFELHEAYNRYPREKKSGFIYHYVGADKPWVRNAAGSDIFWHYARMTAYYHTLSLNYKLNTIEGIINSKAPINIDNTLKKNHKDTHDTMHNMNKSLWDIYHDLNWKIQNMQNTMNDMNKSMWDIYHDLNWKIQNMQNTMNDTVSKYKLFDTIPIMKVVIKDNRKKYYLFNFIHFMTVKVR